MTRHRKPGGFAARPGDPESWIRTADAPSRPGRDAAGFTARLTVDITPELRGRIKIAAFRRDETVADMLRDLLSRSYPPDDGETS